MTTLGVWLPHSDAGSPGAPEQMPLGRAALALADQGIDVIIGQPMSDGFRGARAVPGGWQEVEGAVVHGVYDRFPSYSRGAEFRRGLSLLGSIAVVNPPALTALCRDKLACQRHLEEHGVPMPAVEGESERFNETLAEWGQAFLKPQEGSFGEGVQLVSAGDDLVLDGASVLQRAVPAPAGWAGVCVRVLCQRAVDGGVLVHPGVARRSRLDPVVNAARGAELAPADDVLSRQTLAALDALCRQTFEALACHESGEWLVEAGLDAVIDPLGKPWIIEVNSRPRGRLRELAKAWPARFARQHVLACMSPLQTLASWSSRWR